MAPPIGEFDGFAFAYAGGDRVSVHIDGVLLVIVS